MYENFHFKNQEGIIGYEFPVENAEKVICIVHGIGEYAGRYGRMASYLNKEGIAVVSMDLPGHGLSSGERGHCAPRKMVLGCIDALLEYAREKYKNAEITLYGHSMGGNLVLDYLYRGEQNQLPSKYIVSSPWIELTNSASKLLYPLMVVLNKVKPTMAINSGCDARLLGNPDFVLPYKEDELVHEKITVSCALDCFKIGAALKKGTHPNNHRADGKPFLLMHGSLDKICSVKAARAFARCQQGREGFTYKEWPSYYHEIHNGGEGLTGEEVIFTIRDFILK